MTVPLSLHDRDALLHFFDSAFYLATNPDVFSAGIDPMEHYHFHGWREGRDPSRDFNTNYYLEQNADVRDADVNPLLHYCLHGRPEGRATKPPLSPETMAPTGPKPSQMEIDASVAEKFDREFYLQQNPDVAAAGIDPVWHFFSVGWREGRDPSADFDVSYYLSTNADVREADINPFIHYLQAGRAEGRPSRRPLGAQRDQLEQTKRARIEARNFIYPIPYSESASSAFSEKIGHRPLVIAISHDNYLENFGGVQNVISDEERNFRGAGWDYLHIAPAIHHAALVDAEAADRFCVTLNLNGAPLAIVLLKDVVEQVSRLRSKRPIQVIVHHTMGHIPEMICSLVDAAGGKDPIFWCHDYFAACTSYALLRNGIDYCGAPSPSSQSCTICSYGPERPGHVRRISQLLNHVGWRVVAPSEIALSNFCATTKLDQIEGEVWPIAQLEFTGSRKRSGRGALRVAHLGARQFHKGWHAFSELASSLKEDERYEFYQMGVGPLPIASFIRCIPVLVTRDNPNAMINAVLEHEIDIAFIWPPWPETFNFVVHEALAGGAFVVTRHDGGNVWPAIQKNAAWQGASFAVFEEALQAFRDGQIYEQVKRAELKCGVLHSGYRIANAISRFELVKVSV